MTGQCSLSSPHTALTASFFRRRMLSVYSYYLGYGAKPHVYPLPLPFPSPCPYLDDNFGISGAQSVDKRERRAKMTVRNEAARRSYTQNRAVFHVSATVFGQELHNAKRRKTAAVSQKMRN